MASLHPPCLWVPTDFHLIPNCTQSRLKHFLQLLQFLKKVCLTLLTIRCWFFSESNAMEIIMFIWSKLFYFLIFTGKVWGTKVDILILWKKIVELLFLVIKKEFTSFHVPLISGNTAKPQGFPLIHLCVHFLIHILKRRRQLVSATCETPLWL